MKLGIIGVMILASLFLSCGRASHSGSKDANPSTGSTRDGAANPGSTGDPGDKHAAEPAADSSEKPITDQLRERSRAIMGAGNLPKDFPSDVPIYPDAQSMGGGRMGEHLNVTLKTRDGVLRVLGYYQEQLKKRGWQVLETDQNTGRLKARKSARDCFINIDNEEFTGETLVGITVSPERK